MVKSKRPSQALPPGLHCSSCPTRTQAEWAVLTDEEMLLVEQSKITHYHLRGELLYAQNQPTAAIQCIGSGMIAVIKGEEQGSNIFVRLAHAGETLGYQNLLNGAICSNSAKALSPCTVCHIGTEVLERLFQLQPALEKKFQAHMAEDLDAMEVSILQLASLPVRSRLARLLVALVERYATSWETGVRIMTPPMTRRDMSELLCTRPETLTRTMQAMESEGVLQNQGHAITINRLDSLRSEANPS
jgi:CRP-like cAMP-binding protein